MATDVKERYSFFPSDFESLEQKKTNRYGLEYVNAIYATNIINYPVNNPQYLEYINNREFAEGIYNTNIYKSRMGLDTDTSFLNLDLTSINRIPTILDNMVGKMVNKAFRFQCNPTDTVSRTKFDDKRAEIKAAMFLKEKSSQAEQLTGKPLVAKGQYVPEDNEEAELHMQMNFKLDDAMAMEEALKWVFDNNNFEAESLPLLYRDIFTDKKTAIFRYYDHNKNIRVRRYDHLKIITPYSSYEDFRDIPYQALTDTYTIGDIAKMNPNFTDEQLYNIAKNNAGLNNNMVWNADWYLQYSAYNNAYGAIAYRQFQNFKITVVNFYFLSPIHETKAIKKSVSGKVRVEDKKAGYVPKKEKEKTFGEETEDIEVINKRKLVRFEGFWIPNTDYIWDYKMSKNMDRDVIAGGYSPETELPCRIIMPNQLGMRNKSMVARMKPFEKQLCLAWYHLQQFLIKSRPPGLAINQNALLEVVNGAGEGKALPTDWTKLYDQTGNIIFTDKDASGDHINIPFQELAGGISTAMREFLGVMDYCINKMNEVVGYNTAVDASSPKADALVGVNEQAQAATYDALRPYYNDINKRLIEPVAKRVALMIQDGLRLGNEDFKLALTDAIGKKNVEVLTMGREMPFSTAAISVEIQPDEQEIMQIRTSIQLGIAKETLTPSDELRINQQLKTNVKLAGQLMVYLEGKNIKAKQKMQSAAIQETSLAQQQSAAATSQMRQEEIKLEVQEKSALLKLEYSLKGGLSKQEHEQLMIEIGGKNVGMENVANINAGRAVEVQKISTQGKLLEGHIAKEGAIEKERIVHGSKIQKGFQEHDHKIEQLEKEAELTPKLMPSKK